MSGQASSEGLWKERRMRHETRLRQFEAICREHNGFLRASVWKLTGRDEPFAEAWQNVLMGIWRHVEKLNGHNDRSYLYRIVLSAISKAWRNRADGSEADLDALAAAGKDPLELAVDAELADRVRREIARLPARQGQAVMMRYLEGRDYRQIAGELACGEAAARSHVSKALAALRKRLSGLLDKEPCHDES
jgi:RNA polymerase sigma factor (sigma-70 family)